MNGKKAKALRRLVREELAPHLPERELKGFVWKGAPLPEGHQPAPRVNKPDTQHSHYKALKENYKRQMAK